MGVQGLWELLAPVGRRVSVETLASKKLAIDASIWLVQFTKAMRDEKGEMVRNAHILGFFRRICKLLFLRTRPVFVFDGGTPVLKRRTVAARRRHRENARAKIRKTAEKLLLNHLKTKKLEELAAEMKNSSDRDYARGKRVISADENVVCGTNIPERADETMHGAVDQEILDEMLAASLAAEEGKFAADGPDRKFPSEAELEDDDEIPVIDGDVDPTVLASLPPSMQLDLLVQMREKLIAENRQKYQKIKKSPSKFSELQIQSYLKTVAFRREMDEVQKFAAGRGPEGVQTSRIASEANREFIFSSSFTGDKRVFTSAGVDKDANDDKTAPSVGKVSTLVDSLKGHSLLSQQAPTATVDADVSAEDFGDGVETYQDERGRVRVSRVRGLGIRMTRDLQRNLDLMKEHEAENSAGNVNISKEHACSEKFLNAYHTSSKNSSPVRVKDSEAQNLGKREEISVEKSKKCCHSEASTVENGSTVEVSFSLDDILERNDDVFSQLISGTSECQPLNMLSLGDNTNDCESDFDWEDGTVRNAVTNSDVYSDIISQASTQERATSQGDELNWEEGNAGATFDNQIKHVKPVSRGLLEEELEIQVAIKRSLEDLDQQSDVTPLRQAGISKGSTTDSSPLSQRCGSQKNPCQHTGVDKSKVLDSAPQGSCLQAINSTGEKCSSVVIPHDSKPSKIHMSDESARSFFTQTNAGVQIKKKIQIDGVPDNVLPQNQISGESSLDPSVRSKDSHGMSADFSTSGGSDIPTVIVGKTGENADRTNSSTLSDSHISKEDNFVCDIHNQSWGISSNMLESTFDEELLHLNHERRNLGDEQRKLERNAESVSSEMFAECQELLQMFGLPFIIAPMEAEAQCAYMESMNLVDGVVTDDSDVFLFGARNVYKNIFDDRKYVETYLMKDIENELGLTREMLIRMALLLGSDYTEGISGIGIVNAIEVVHAFPEEDGFQKFREWVESPDPSVFEKLYPHIGDSNNKRSSKASRSNEDGSNATDPSSDGTKENGVHSSNDILEIRRTFMDKHRNVSKNWHIPPSFPSDTVVSAYINPQVDESTEPFTWGKPDLPLLRKLCWEKFAWANQKADDLLVPVLKEYNKHETQLRLEAFYTFNEKFAKIRSQRIKRAVKGITGKTSSEFLGTLEGEDAEVKQRRQTSEMEKDKRENHSEGKHYGRRISRHPKKYQKQPAERMHAESIISGESPVKEISKSNINDEKVRVGKGRKRKGEAERGRSEIHVLGYEATDTTSSNCSYDFIETENLVEIDCSSTLRRSMRQRKHVPYAEENSDDGIHDFPEHKRGICSDASPAAPEPCGGQSTGADNSSSGVDIVAEVCGSGRSKNDGAGDHLGSGGGFCIDDGGLDGDPTRPDSSTENRPMDKGTADGDYLLSGGGFCVDAGDSNVGGSPTHLSSCPEDTSSSGPLPKAGNSLDHQETDILDEETKGGHREAGGLTEQETGSARPAGFGFLTAMASLKRKRR